MPARHDAHLYWEVASVEVVDLSVCGCASRLFIARRFGDETEAVVLLPALNF